MQRNSVVLIPSARFGIQNARFKNFPFRTRGWNESFFVSFLGLSWVLEFSCCTETCCHKTKKELQSSFWLQKALGRRRPQLVLCLFRRSPKVVVIGMVWDNGSFFAIDEKRIEMLVCICVYMYIQITYLIEFQENGDVLHFGFTRICGVFLSQRLTWCFEGWFYWVLCSAFCFCSTDVGWITCICLAFRSLCAVAAWCVHVSRARYH